MTSASHTFSYDDPRLVMTLAGRMLVRTVQLISMVVFVTTTILALASTIDWVRWLGIFMAFVLVDFIIHHGEADVAVAEFAGHDHVELSHALTPRLSLLIHHAFDASRITHIDPALELICALAPKKEVRRSLARENIDAAEVMGKIREFMARDEAHQSMSKKERKDILQNILAAAFARAEAEDHRFITLSDMFFAIPNAGGLAARLFTMFDIPTT
jgi:hypothetical protein